MREFKKWYKQINQRKGSGVKLRMTQTGVRCGGRPVVKGRGNEDKGGNQHPPWSGGWRDTGHRVTGAESLGCRIQRMGRLPDQGQARLCERGGEVDV